ncbi:MAG: hypothetical protein FJX72_05225 [Armatimonadetes bacterium]|nr:hypothetical protein [Armatimonadota bacterium]
MQSYRYPSSDLLPGCRVRVWSRPSWGTGIVLDVTDPGVVLVEFEALERPLKVGRAAVELVNATEARPGSLRIQADD